MQTNTPWNQHCLRRPNDYGVSYVSEFLSEIDDMIVYRSLVFLIFITIENGNSDHLELFYLKSKFNVSWIVLKYNQRVFCIIHSSISLFLSLSLRYYWFYSVIYFTHQRGLKRTYVVRTRVHNSWWHRFPCVHCYVTSLFSVLWWWYCFCDLNHFLMWRDLTNEHFLPNHPGEGKGFVSKVKFTT